MSDVVRDRSSRCRPQQPERKHTLWCRIRMHLGGKRRICLCGKSPPRTKSQRYHDMIRRRNRYLESKQ